MQATLEQIHAALLYAFLSLRIGGMVQTDEGYTAPALHSAARTQQVINLANKRLALKGVRANLQKVNRYPARATFRIAIAAACEKPNMQQDVTVLA